MTKIYDCILIIAVMSLINFLIRATPFVLFRNEKKMPKPVAYLGRVLPPAMMSFLVVYCVRSVHLTQGNHGIPQIAGIITAMALHAYKRNTLLSISVATIVYMVLLRGIVL